MKTASLLASNLRSRVAWPVLFLILVANGAIGSTLVAWGPGYWGQTNVPPGLNDAIALAAGQYHVLALRANGTVVAWGGDGSDYEEANRVPPGLDNVRAISAGTALSVALRFDGTVVAWGHEGPDGYTNVPSGLNDAVAVAAGGYHGLALRANGTLIGWGQSMAGQISPPSDLTNAIAIAAGSHHSLALRADGTVVAFGHPDQGQTTVPAGLSNVIAIAAVSTRSFALKADGTVVQWGSNADGAFAPPPGLDGVVALAAGARQTLALRADGTVVAWGDADVATVPPGLSGVVALAANNNVNLALIGPLPVAPLISRGSTWRYNDTGFEQGAAWRAPGFDDRAWPEGRAQLGFGDGDEATLLRRQPPNGTPIFTAYFRRAFVLNNAGAFTNLALRLVHDDGAVVYVNGVEAFRVNLPPGPATYGTFASTVMPDNSVASAHLSPALLLTGTNVVAVEVHQASLVSSDLSFDLELTGAGTSSPPVITQPPASQTLMAGSMVTFTVAVTGTPPFRYQWQKNGTDLLGQTNALLTLVGVQSTDAGTYRVRVMTSANTVFSDEAVLTVLPAVVRRSAPRDQVEPSIAANGSVYLVVWTDSRNRDTDYDIYGARVTPDGQVLDPNGIRICTAPFRQDLPTVASDGRDFFVVWQDDRGNVGIMDPELYGARVTADGMVRDPDGILISSALQAKSSPRIAFNGTNYLVVWNDYRFYSDSHRVPDIYGTRVQRDGVVLDPGGLAIAATDTAERSPTVAALNGDFFVVWGTSQAGVMGTRVTAGGEVVHPGGFRISPHHIPTRAPLAANQTGYLVIWADERNQHTTQYDLWGRRIAASGETGLPGELSICNVTNYQYRSSLAASSNEFFCVWMDGRYGYDTSRLYATRITTNGVVTPNGFDLSVNPPPRPYDDPAVASLNGGYLVVWPGKEGLGEHGSMDIVGVRVSASGRVDETNGFLISSLALETPVITWTHPADIVYGTPLGSAQLNATASVAGTFNYSPPPGTVLNVGSNHVLSVRFAPADAERYGPAEASVRLNVRPAPAPFVRRVIALEMIQLLAAPPAHVSVYAVEDQPPAGWQLMSISHGGTFDPLTGKVKFGPFFDAEFRGFSYLAFPPEDAQGVFAFTGSASADGVNTPIAGEQFRVVVGCHPAEVRDGRPPDWRMTIDEVTAYASAWRRGSDWIVPPNPIPIDYVTRAAFLWRGGECYEIDSAATNGTLWWVSCGRSIAVAGPAPTSVPGIATPSVGRQVPGLFVADVPVPVTLAVTPPFAANSYAVEEHLPAGWTVRDLSDGGEWDAVNNAVKWGPFFDHAARRLTYQAIAPPTAASTSVLEGSASFDGVSISTGTSPLARAACVLGVAGPAGRGPGRLRLAGPVGQRFVIEASTDLATWNPLAVVTIGPGPTEFSDPSASAFSQRFYRARPAP